MEREQKVSFIPCLTFVKKGVGVPKLQKVKPTKEELQEIMKEMKLREAEYNSRSQEEKGEVEDKNSDEENQDVDDFYDMDNYNDDEAEDTPANGGIASSADISALMNNADDSDEPDTDEEPDEYSVKPDDNLIICGHVEGDACILEVYVFNSEKGELFIFNDMFLPSYPICVEWLDFSPKKEEPGNFAAVGCVTPEIGVWDLGVTGCLEPAFTLGSRKKKSMRHRDAVLDLSWHQDNRSVLASGSADKTVILWDMAKIEGVTKIESFEEKVQSLKWHPFEVQSLLTGCCDGKARLYDCRNPKYFKTWGFEGEIERVLWNHFDPFYFFVTTDKGMVYYVDTRNTNPVWTLKAHDKETTGISMSSHCRDLLMTASMGEDEAVKVWDLQGGTPTFVSEKKMNIGQVYALSSCPDVPYVFCAGGSKKDNHLYVWDSRENDTVLQRFKGRRFEEVTVSNMDVDNDPQPSTSRSSNNIFSVPSDGRIKVSKSKTDSKEVVAAASKSEKKKQKKKSRPKNPKGPPK